MYRCGLNFTYEIISKSKCRWATELKGSQVNNVTFCCLPKALNSLIEE